MFPFPLSLQSKRYSIIFIARAVDVMDVDEDIDGERAENEEDPQQNVDRNDEDGDQNDEGSFSPHMQTDPAPQWDHEDIWNQLMFPRLDEV